MRAWGVLLLVLALLSPIRTAAQAFVQAGEHRNFTRVVTQLPDGIEWTVAQQGRQITLTLPGHQAGFDIGEVFDLIPRDRLARIASQSDRLILDLACDCRVAAFDVSGGYVALDILSPDARSSVDLVPILPPLTPQVALSTDATLPNIKPDRFPVLQGASPQPVPVPNLLMADLPEPRRVPPDAIAPVDAPSSSAPSPLGRETIDPNARQLLLEIQDRLSREMGTAATRGVLEPRGPSALPDITRPQIDTDVFADDLPPDLEGEQAGQALSNIRISTSMDLPALQGEEGSHVSLNGVVCPAPDTFDLTTWTDGRAFDTQVSALRQALFGEFDRLDTDIARRLARTYLYFGFGAEAKQVLQLDTELARAEHLLLAMAEIFEQGHAQPSAPLLDLTDCASDTALWAVMAHETLPTEMVIDPAPTLLALNSLPAHLRRILAPGLSNRFLAHGEVDAAAAALRSLERLPNELPPEAQLAQAKVTLKTGESDAGKEQLQDVIETGADPSPDALIALIHEKIAQDQPIDAMTAGLVEAYAKELEETALGPDLREAHVLALMKSGQFDRAFDVADALDEDDVGTKSTKLQGFMLRELTTAADDVIFLDHVFQQSNQVLSTLPRRDRLNLIERLLTLGFAQSAQRLINTLPDRPPHPPSRILAARIALALDQPIQAHNSLEGIDDVQANLLRAQAKRAAGDHAEARDLFNGANQDWDAVQAGWLAEDWENLTPPDAPIFGPVVTLATNTPEAVPQGEGMLARSGAVLEESGAARQTILDLLNAPEITLLPAATAD